MELAQANWLVVHPDGMMETRAGVEEEEIVTAQPLDPAEEMHCAL